MARQPVLDGDGFAIWEQVDNASPLEVADDAAVALTALPRPIIDADDVYRPPMLENLTARNPQQGIPAHRQHQPPGQRSSRSTAQGNGRSIQAAMSAELICRRPHRRAALRKCDAGSRVRRSGNGEL